jgi:hypothetical protein
MDNIETGSRTIPVWLRRDDSLVAAITQISILGMRFWIVTRTGDPSNA